MILITVGIVQLLVFPLRITGDLPFRCSSVWLHKATYKPINGALASCHLPKTAAFQGFGGTFLLFWCVLPGFRTCRKQTLNPGHLRGSAGPLLCLGHCYREGFLTP